MENPRQMLKISDDDVDAESGRSVVSMSLDEWTRTDKVDLALHYPALFSFGGEKSWSDIVRAPNADDDRPESIAEVANAAHGQKHRTVARPFCWGSLVPLGHIQIVKNNGMTEVMAQGRYSMKLFGRGIFPPASWGRILPITEDVVADETFTMVRVSRGNLGLAVENGHPVLLDEGLHVYNSALFNFKEMVQINVPHIRHMSYHIVRVQKGFFAKVLVGQVAKLLTQGVHVVDDPVFDYHGQVPVLGDYLQHGTIHIIQVPQGSVGLVNETKIPRLLHEGVHIYDSPTLAWKGLQLKQSLQPIVHGTITRFRVQKGEWALVLEENEPFIVTEPGTYLVDSPTFSVVKHVEATKKDICHEARKIVTVYPGEVGISYRAGLLEVLQPGRHDIDDAEHIFHSFMNTRQRSLRLGLTDETVTCKTKDLVKIGIKAEVFFCIDDPAKVLTEVGVDKIDGLVVETSIATMTSIMRSTTLHDLSRSSTQGRRSQMIDAQDIGKVSNVLYFDKAHDQFIENLHSDFLRKFGINVTDIRIKQIKILDEELATTIANEALNSAVIQNELLNLDGQTKISIQTQARDSAVQIIKARGGVVAQQTRLDSELRQAEAETVAMQVTAEGQAAVVRIQAEGEGQATRVAAEATLSEQEARASGVKLEAEASVATAEALAKGIELKADADAERATVLARAPLGEKLALLGVYGEIIKSTHEGMEKVVYTDDSKPQPGELGSLLSLQCLQG